MIEPMHPKRFWDLLGCATDWDDPEDRFEDIEDWLGSLPEEDILAFYVRYDRCVEDARTAGLVMACFLAVPRARGRLDYDYFLGFGCWLVDQDWPVYRAVLADPDSLADVRADLPWVSDGLWLAAQSAWQTKAGRRPTSSTGSLRTASPRDRSFPRLGPPRTNCGEACPGWRPGSSTDNVRQVSGLTRRAGFRA